MIKVLPKSFLKIFFKFPTFSIDKNTKRDENSFTKLFKILQKICIQK